MSIVSPTSVDPAARISQSADNQQRGSFQGVQIRGGIVQDATTDISFDLRSGTANIGIAQRAGERKLRERKGILFKRATDIRRATEKAASRVLGDLTGIVIRDFHAAIKDYQKRKRLSLSDARDLVEQYFDDPSLQHAAVLAVSHMESQMGDNDGLADMLKELAQTLMEEQGPAIRAGYNINPAIALFAGEELETYSTLREAYREILLSDASEEQIYNFLVHILPLRLRYILRKRRKDQQKKRQKRNPVWEDEFLQEPI